jgi:hypothetical protein
VAGQSDQVVADLWIGPPIRTVCIRQGTASQAAEKCAFVIPNPRALRVRDLLLGFSHRGPVLAASDTQKNSLTVIYLYGNLFAYIYVSSISGANLSLPHKVKEISVVPLCAVTGPTHRQSFVFNGMNHYESTGRVSTLRL